MSNTNHRYNYNSGNLGNNYTLEHGEFLFIFNEVDFGQRVEYAAKQLNMIEDYLSEEEREDLVSLVLHAGIKNPSSPLAYHLRENEEELVRSVNGGNVVYWLRRLVFRGARIDQRLLEGEVSVELDRDWVDFIYFEQAYSAFDFAYKKNPIKLSNPSWANVTYRSKS